MDSQNNSGYLYADRTFQIYPTYGIPLAFLERSRMLKLTLRFSF